jgi:hypothetical protein
LNVSALFHQKFRALETHLEGRIVEILKFQPREDELAIRSYDVKFERKAAAQETEPPDLAEQLRKRHERTEVRRTVEIAPPCESPASRLRNEHWMQRRSSSVFPIREAAATVTARWRWSEGESARPDTKRSSVGTRKSSAPEWQRATIQRVIHIHCRASEKV